MIESGISGAAAYLKIFGIGLILTTVVKSARLYKLN